jgi:hypothetical protein
MLFFHIDELTSSSSGPNEETTINSAMVRFFTKHLKALQARGAEFLTCSGAREHWLDQAVVEKKLRMAVVRT